MQALGSHRNTAGDGDSDGQLLRCRNHRPIAHRRYDYLFTRVGHYQPWVKTQQISVYWLRHTTLTWWKGTSGMRVARACAGHEGRNGAGSTVTYVCADIYEVATALAALTGKSHP